jgi:hypothetical protein
MAQVFVVIMGMKEFCLLYRCFYVVLPVFRGLPRIILTKYIYREGQQMCLMRGPHGAGNVRFFYSICLKVLRIRVEILMIFKDMLRPRNTQTRDSKYKGIFKKNYCKNKFY